jgi:HEAT repeat protein
MNRFIPLLIVSLCFGCEGPEPKQAAKPASAASSKPPHAQQATNATNDNKPKAPDFRNVEAALEALSTGLAGDDQAAVRGATAWLAKEGGSAVGPVAAEVNDANNDLRFRLACLNVLGYLGPPAAGPILEATRNETPEIRAKATEMLGSIQPSSSQIVSRLMELLDAKEDPDLRRSAVGSLGRIGKPAQRAAPKLQEILNSDADESLRGAAKTALKQIDPRIGFGKP